MALFLPNSAAAQIKSLIMPGEVIEGHAEVEHDCDSCHLAFERGRQRDLCLDCHEDVAADIDLPAGFHGLFDTARQEPCASCHTDHEGRSADIVNLNRATFDHDFTDFSLVGNHGTARCDGCHAADTKFRDAPQGCFSCHEDDNVHEDFLGTECGDCHSPTGWPDVEFDHDTTGFGLVGHHLQTGCLDCHQDQTFQNTPTECYGCHAEDDAHDGRSGQECGNCHSPTGWEDTKFDHARDTLFALEGRHAELTCDDCHSEDPFADELDVACVSCHLDDDNHEGHFGTGCDTCHVSTEWAFVVFRHDVDTDYALHGAHETIACEACHVEPIFEVALLTGCNDCHAEDDPHEGTQGSECQDCHNEVSWPDDVFFDHDITRFPLLGHHADTACEDCHTSRVFADAKSACVACHVEDDPHNGNFDTRCESCHNPVDWNIWTFDHDVQTDFPLQGAHIGVACDECHRISLDRVMAIDGTCLACHRADDIHDGEFGYDCGRCHTSSSFKEVRSIQ